MPNCAATYAADTAENSGLAAPIQTEAALILGKRSKLRHACQKLHHMPYGAGFDAFGLASEQLVMVSAAHRRDLLWAMEEALRCGAITAVIGEMRAGAIDGVAIRRLSLAAAESGTLALLLRTEPPGDASTAATRWVVGAAPSIVPGTPRVAAQLVRNRRGPTRTWILEWSDSDGQFILATHAQPLAAPALDRPHRQVA